MKIASCIANQSARNYWSSTLFIIIVPPHLLKILQRSTLAPINIGKPFFYYKMNIQIDATLLIAALSIIWSVSKLINSWRKLPPGPRGLPIVGYLPFLRQDLHHQFTEMAHQYGPIYKIWLGSKLGIVISSPSLIKEVVRDHDTIFANRFVQVGSRIATFDFNEIAFAPYGPQWRHLRKLFVREMLSSANLEASYSLRKDEIRKGINEVYGKIGTSINITDLVFRLAFNVIINLIIGNQIKGEKGEETLATLLPLVSGIISLIIKPNISDFFPVLARFDIQGIAKQMSTLVQRQGGIIDGIIDEQLEIFSKKSEVSSAGKDGKKDFLQILINLMQEEGNKASLGKIQIKALLVETIGAGTDTTGATTEWIMAELLSHPKEMEKVQKELDQVIGSENIVEEFHLTKLEYLDAVIKESARLHPIAPFLAPRSPRQTCIVGGYTIPKDSIIFLNVWSVQRDPLVWFNPSEFKPERFLGSTTEKYDFHGNNFSYLPFGSGRRNCAGIPLAEKMVKYIIASLLHSFEWRLQEGESLDMSGKLSSVLKKEVPLRAIAIPRLSHSGLYE